MFDLTQQFTNSESYFERFESKANPKPKRVNAKFVRDTLVKKGWEHAWGALFGKDFVKDLAEHHRASIEWAWDAIVAICNGQDPEYFSDWPMFSRGHGKSTLARRIAVADAIVSYAFERVGFCLYLSGTDDKINTHSLSLGNLLQSRETSVSYYCPELAQVRKQEVNNRAMGWRSNFFYTEAGYIYQFGSLMAGLAGANVDNQRPSFIILDDIDDRSDSEVQSKNKMRQLTSEVLPMGATGTRTYWPQNLISRYSCMYQMYKGKVKALTNRRPSKPVPALDNPEYEWRTDANGLIRPIIIAGTPTWQRMDVKACQEELDRIGLDAFKRECQHEVEQSREGVLLRNYNDNIHVISESEFASVYGNPREWLKWNKWMIHDWARTKSDEHANVAAYVTVSNQNTRFPGVKFIVEPMAFKAASEPEDVAERFLTALTPFAYDKVTWQQLRKDELHRSNSHLYTHTAEEKTTFERQVLARVVPRYARPILEHYHVKSGVMSHSEDTIRKIYNSCYGFNMWPSNPGKLDHIETINDDLRIDFSVKHPFRPDQMGYTRFFIIAKDDLDDPAPRKLPNGLVVYRPTPYRDELSGSELYDADLLRYQMSEWRLKETKVTESGESEEAPFKGKDDFPQCLAADTLVATNRGTVPISEVKVGDFAWTRKGFRRVIASEMTAERAEVFTVSFSNGAVITGTGDHPIFVESRGFVPLQMVCNGDTILGIWQTTKANPGQSKLCTKESDFIATRIRNNNHIRDIICRTSESACSATVTFMLRFGKTLTAQFRKAARFTTSTKISTITTFPILSVFPKANIANYTDCDTRQTRPDLNAWTKYDHSPMRGGGHQKAALTCPVKASNTLSGGKLSPVIADIAESNIKRHSNEAATVERIAPNGQDKASKPESSLAKRLLSYVKNAAKNLRRNVFTKNSAQKVVVNSIQPSGAQSVFNLEVEGQPEFFANGILVHNCLQMAYHKKVFTNQELSDTEKFEEKMNYEQPGLTLAAIENVPEQNRSAKWVMRMEEQRKFDKENKGDIEAGQGDFAENFQEDDFGWLE